METENGAEIDLTQNGSENGATEVKNEMEE